jgi:hypothetical protein
VVHAGKLIPSFWERFKKHEIVTVRLGAYAGHMCGHWLNQGEKQVCHYHDRFKERKCIRIGENLYLVVETGIRIFVVQYLDYNFRGKND